MKQFLKIAVLGTAAIMLLGIAGPPLAALLMSAAIAAVGVHYFVKSNSLAGQILWGSLIAVGVLSALSNVPGLIVIAIAVGIYYVYKKDNDTFTSPANDDDPFQNFEREWAKMQK